MNNARKLTVSYINNNSDNPASVPYLRLRGLWLEKLGWEIGDKVEVQASEEEIIIKRINLLESKKTPEPKKEIYVSR